MHKAVALPSGTGTSNNSNVTTNGANIKKKRFFLPPDALSTNGASIGAVISFIVFIYSS
jgi:hypothetical protein